jgi:hypothetical protein
MLKDFGFGMISGLDSKVVDMINAHPLIIIGSCDRALVPAASRAFGARVKDGGKALEVLVSHVLSQQTIANIQDTRRIAATFVQPETYESYQFKGRLTSCDEPDEDDGNYQQNIAKPSPAGSEPLARQPMSSTSFLSAVT